MKLLLWRYNGQNRLEFSDYFKIDHNRKEYLGSIKSGTAF